MLIQKINDASDGIERNQNPQLSSLIKSMISKCRMGALSLSESIELIKSRNYRTDAVIENSSWEDLGIDEPVFGKDEKAFITGVTEE